MSKTAKKTAEKSATKTAEKSASKSSPFKTRKTKIESAKVNDTVTPPKSIADAIDAFRECQDQARHYEGEATIHKDLVVDFAAQEFSKRLTSGLDSSFKILGHETMVTYIVSDAGAGLTDEDVAEIEERWGEDAVQDLVVNDYGSIKFDAKVLEANFDAVVKALQALPQDVYENLFKPMLMKAKPGAAETAKKYVKNSEDLRDLLRSLKMKNYIK